MSARMIRNMEGSEDLSADRGAAAAGFTLVAVSLANARFPKLMFIAVEEYTDASGKTITIEESTLQALLEDALLARGFDLVARDRLLKMRKTELQVFREILDDDKAAARAAMSYGAEYIVTAVARIKHTSQNDLGMNEHHGFAELNLKAVNASSAAVVASFKQGGNSPANAYSEEDLRVKTVQHVAPPLVDNLLTRIIESWDRESTNGVRYSVKVMGVKSYRDQGLPLVKLMEGLPNVKQVKKISFGGERLELEVFFPSEFDVSKLEDLIMQGAIKARRLEKLDVVYSRGRELSFKL